MNIVNSTTTKTTSQDLVGGLLEAATMGDGEKHINRLENASYPTRALNGSSLIMSAPSGIVVSPLSSASNSLSYGNIGKAGCMAIMAPASASAGISLISGMKP